MAQWQPQKSPYYKNDFSHCYGPTQFDPLFMENVHDLSDTLVKVMITFGIDQCKAKAVRSIIVKAFQFYDVKRHRFILRPEDQASLSKCELLDEFENLAMMNSVEASLCYQLLKRAIKAFFLHTPSHSIRSPITEAIVLKEHEFAWKHAAQRSIQIFQPYEGLFFNTLTDYKNKVTRLYRELFIRFKNRAEPIIVEDYHPRGCTKKVIIGTQPPPKLYNEKLVCNEKCQKSKELREYLKTLTPKELAIETCTPLPAICQLLEPYDQRTLNTKLKESRVQKKMVKAKSLKKPKKLKKPKNVDLNLPRCCQCNCPQIFCECKTDPNTGIVGIDCSQGPFECQWVRMYKVERLDPCIHKPEQHICPIDCLMTDDYSSDSDFSSSCCCYCDCSDDSSIESISDYEVQNEIVDNKQYENDQADDDDNLEKLMLQNMPKRKSADPKARCVDGALRVISTIPPFKPEVTKPIKRPQKTSTKRTIKKSKK